MGIYLVTFESARTLMTTVTVAESNRQRSVEQWAGEIGRAMHQKVLEIQKMQVIKVKGDPR